MAKPRTTVPEAREITLESARPLPVQKLPIEDAGGYVLAEEIQATEPVQPFRNAAMDGYAVRWSDVEDSPEEPLDIAGEVAAGDVGEITTDPGEAVRIMTGAPVPEGLDTVIRREDAEVDNNRVRFTRLPSRGKGDNIRQPGEDLKPGETVLNKGQVIRPYELGTGILAGRKRVEVHRRPGVAVISTGDELVGEPGAPLDKGQIRDINRHTLSEASRQAGARVDRIGYLPDDRSQTLELVEEVIKQHDVVITSGGISMGDYDFVGDILETLDIEFRFHKIWQKPGKPLGFARNEECLFFALPGNVVSSMVNFEIYVRPVLRTMRGLTRVQRIQQSLEVTESLRETDRRTFFFRGQYVETGAKSKVQLTDTGQGSHIMTSLSEADCLIEVPPDTTTEAGDQVTVHDLREPVPLPV